MWKTPHLQKKSVKNPASSKVKCEPLGLPGGDLVYHIFEPHITWKLNFFPKLKKFPNASIRANMRFVKTRFVRRILAISRVLEFFPRIWWGSNSHRLLPYHSRRPLHYHTWWSTVVFTYYVLLLFFYLNPLIRFLLMSANIPDLSIMGIITSECLFRPIRRNIVFSRKRFFWANLLLPQVRKIWAKCDWDSNPDLSSRSQWASPLHYFHWR